MAFVLTDGGTTVVQYPYSSKQLRTDNPNTSFPSDFTNFDFAAWDMFEVQPVAQPAPVNPDNVVVEGDPVFNDPNWEQNWIERAPVLGELSAVKWAKRAAIKQEMALQIKVAALSSGLLEEDYELINEQDGFTSAVMAFMVANASANFRTALGVIRQNARSLLNAVDAATTLTEIAAVDESTGWS